MPVSRRLSPPPAVVFVTAHDLYALKAFDVAALDFLLKPVDPDRLAVTVDRLRRRQSALSPAEPRRRSNPIETNRLQEQRLHLRIDPRPDGSPWLAEVTSLARALAEAEQRLAAY